MESTPSYKKSLVLKTSCHSADIARWHKYSFFSILYFAFNKIEILVCFRHKGKSESFILQWTPRVCQSYPRELLSYLKSTVDLCHEYISLVSYHMSLSEDKAQIVHRYSLLLQSRDPMRYFDFLTDRFI